jgi:hypothetical protein
MFADSRAELERARSGNPGALQTIPERAVGERLMSPAASVRVPRFVARAAPRRAVERIEESFESAGLFASRRAQWGREADSTVAMRVAAREAGRVAAGPALRRSTDSVATKAASAACSRFMRASSHWARRACTSASTHSSKISSSSLRRLATAFRRLRRNDSIEASDDVARYSKGRSMASGAPPNPALHPPWSLALPP